MKEVLFLVISLLGYPNPQGIDDISYMQLRCQTAQEELLCQRMYEGVLFDIIEGEYLGTEEYSDYHVQGFYLDPESIEFIFEVENGVVVTDTRPDHLKYKPDPVIEDEDEEGDF